MRQLLLSLFLFQTIYSFAGTRTFDGITLNLNREKGSVRILISTERFKDINQIFVDRSDLSKNLFRQMRVISDDVISQNASDSIVFLDDFTVSSAQDLLYRLRVEYKTGEIKVYPPVKVAGYHTVDNTIKITESTTSVLKELIKNKNLYLIFPVYDKKGRLVNPKMIEENKYPFAYSQDFTDAKVIESIVVPEDAFVKGEINNDIVKTSNQPLVLNKNVTLATLKQGKIVKAVISFSDHNYNWKEVKLEGNYTMANQNFATLKTFVKEDFGDENNYSMDIDFSNYVKRAEVFYFRLRIIEHDGKETISNFTQVILD